MAGPRDAISSPKLIIDDDGEILGSFSKTGLTLADGASVTVDDSNISGTSPAITLTNETAEDTDAGRACVINLKGTQSGSEVTTLAKIQASHDGASDDEAGDLILYTNDGSDGDSPTERMRIDSAGLITMAGEAQVNNAFAIGSSRGAANLVHIDGAGSALTGTQQFAVKMAGTHFSDAATSEMYCVSTGGLTTAAGSYSTTRFIHYEAGAFTAGSGHTIGGTRESKFYAGPKTSGAWIHAKFTDDITNFSGDFFIYQGGTDLNRFNGSTQFVNGLRTELSTANVSNPPTDAELDSEFGTPATVGTGFFAMVDDAGGGSNMYMVASDGTNWWHAAMTKAT